MTIAVIPARGGSKRIKKKNLKNFCGEPIIGVTIKILKETKIFEDIIVSTDDREISEYVTNLGASVPFIRPKKLSGDNIGILPVIKHTAEWLHENNKDPDYICCVYATAPLIQKNDILLSLEKIKKEKSDFIVPITTFDYPIMRALKINTVDQLEMLFYENIDLKSNDLEEFYHDTGSFYWAKNSAILNDKKIFNSNTSFLKIDRFRVQDIDTMEDWDKAELLYQILKQGKK